MTGADYCVRIARRCSMALLLSLLLFSSAQAQQKADASLRVAIARPKLLGDVLLILSEFAEANSFSYAARKNIHVEGEIHAHLQRRDITIIASNAMYPLIFRISFFSENAIGGASDELARLKSDLIRRLMPLKDIEIK